VNHGPDEDGDNGDASDGAATGDPGDGVAAGRTAAPRTPSLTVAVRTRRTDRAFFLRLRDAIQQNHRALQRLGT
jgi:hypothetical protein